MEKMINLEKDIPHNILVDFWGTLVESKKRDQYWGELFINLQEDEISKREFLNYWKENWFKSEIDLIKFQSRLKNKFNLKGKYDLLLSTLTDYKNMNFIGERLDELSNWVMAKHQVYLVSDCGMDTKEFVENSELKYLLNDEFYSFKYKTTKDEELYSIVRKEIGKNCIMIGDDYKRDYIIPKKYGFDSMLVKKPL